MIAIISSAAAGIIAGAAVALIVKAVGENNQTEEAYRRGYFKGYEEGQKYQQKVCNDYFTRGYKDIEELLTDEDRKKLNEANGQYFV